MMEKLRLNKFKIEAGEIEQLTRIYLLVSFTLWRSASLDTWACMRHLIEVSNRTVFVCTSIHVLILIHHDSEAAYV